MQVTISLLPVSLSLVHIPRSRLAQLSHPILRQILQPNPTFFNITCNEVELSLFADENVLEDFEPIARRDRLKEHSRSSLGSSHKFTGRKSVENIEISHDKWSVLQIDSHGGQIDKSGSRVNEVSALLAAAGISILYQSSYMSDFIFVKETHLQAAIRLFTAAGFDLYTDTDFSTPGIIPESGSQSPTHNFRSVPNTPTIFSCSRSATDPELSHPSAIQEAQGCSLLTQDTSVVLPSLSGSDVHLLPSDLACVGLSDELGVDHWGLKIIKLVAFPDLISSPQIPKHPTSHTITRSSVSIPLIKLPPPVNPLFHGESSITSGSSSSSEDDGYFSHSPTRKPLSYLTKLNSPSCTELTKPSNPSLCKSPSKHLVPASSPTKSTHTVGDAHVSQLPFFSYTKTHEGCSLTADVYTLATLFPSHERHMVICSGELDAADQRLAKGMGSPENDSDEDENYSRSLGGTLRCLQIDLQRFGLDKYGLVNRFSQVLDENCINHMYSSTFKTANLLVDKKHATRALGLLRAC